MVSDHTLITNAANFLIEEHQQKHQFKDFPKEIAPQSLSEAYEIQDKFVSLKAADNPSIGGYKIALTTPVMQKMVGVNHPCSGIVLASSIHQSPTTVNLKDFARMGIECEIAFRLTKDLPSSQGPYQRDTVADAVGSFMPAFELIEDRNAVYGNLQVLPLVADNCFNVGVVLGKEMSFPTDIDLGNLNGQLKVNNERKATGKSEDVMGHPLEALTWLANSLAERNASLQSGMIVMTGSIVTTQFPSSGDLFEYQLGEFDPVKVTLI